MIYIINNLEWTPISNSSVTCNNELFSYYRPCPICGALKSRNVWNIEQFQFFTDSKEYAKRIDIYVHQCMQCYALYLNPVYSKLGFDILFNEASQSYGSSIERNQERVNWLTKHQLLKEGQHILDVGCYDGKFLSMCPDKLKRTGVDVDQTVINRNREKFKTSGIEFFCADIENFEIEDTPNLITMFHVLEHLPNPVQFLTKIHSLSRNNCARLLIEGPILEQYLVEDIVGFFGVEHLTHFTRNSLTNCFNLAGWEVEEWIEEDYIAGCRVLLKPSSGEIQNKMQVNVNDVRIFYQYLSLWYESLAKAEEKLSLFNDRQVWIIWGGGMHTEYLYQTSSFFNKSRKYIIVDSDLRKQGKRWRGIPIYSPDIINNINDQEVMVLISTHSSQAEIENELLDKGISSDRIVKLY